MACGCKKKTESPSTTMNATVKVNQSSEKKTNQLVEKIINRLNKTK